MTIHASLLCHMKLDVIGFKDGECAITSEMTSD